MPEIHKRSRNLEVLGGKGEDLGLGEFLGTMLVHK
jgi:hypothetical protein